MLYCHLTQSIKLYVYRDIILLPEVSLRMDGVTKSGVDACSGAFGKIKER